MLNSLEKCEHNVHLDPSGWELCERVSDVDNESLCQCFIECLDKNNPVSV